MTVTCVGLPDYRELTHQIEIYVPLKQPLLPMTLLRIRNFVACVIIGSVGQMVWYAINVLWPDQITQFYTTDNILVGLMSVSVPPKSQA